MYGKLFERAFTGSMFGLGPVFFATWAYIIAFTKEDHTVEINPLLVAATLGCKAEEVDAAVQFFCEPDPKSRCKDHDGRKMLRIEGTSFLYHVVTHDIYRAMKSSEELRVYNREAKALSRARLAEKVTSTDVNVRVKKSSRMSRQSEAYSEAEAEPKERARGASAPPTLADVQAWVSEKGYHFDPGAFVAYYEEREWRRNDGKKLRDWHLACVSWESREEKVSTSRKSLEGALGPTAPPAAQNPHGLRLAKDGASICYNGQWFHAHPDGKRWLTEEECRPDGRHISYEAGNPELNNEVYAEMNRLAGRDK